MHTRIVGYKKYLERKVQGFELEYDWSFYTLRLSGNRKECGAIE